MPQTVEVKVPDIGDFTDVPVIEVLVKAGDSVKAEDSLVTLESDKATMDVPSPSAGVIKDVKVKLGDKVSEGSVIVTLEAEAGNGARAASPAQAAAAPAAAPAAGSATASATATPTSPSAPAQRETGAASTPAGAAQSIEVKVPDIGDFKDVPVIEVLVKPGDAVKAEDSLVTLESEKATMDIPAPSAGVIKEVKVKLGDKVSEGNVIAVLEAGGGRAPAPPTHAAV
jgi:pyruvate dehydrogenase E2 component (dihydrolipoamide acetyltransferase)